MSRLRISALLGFCAALAACEGTTAPRDITAPEQATPAFDITAEESGLAPIFDESIAPADVSVQQIPTGGRASGHFELSISPFLGIAEERYSFNAQTTTFPLAKGQMEVHALQAGVGGITFVVHSEVICLSVVDNQAYIGGIAKKVTVNNETRPDLEGLSTIWRVQDNGEGANDPDLASLVFFGANPIAHCTFRFQLPMTPSANGNIQVRGE